jgi:hypothetical protein
MPHPRKEIELEEIPYGLISHSPAHGR